MAIQIQNSAGVKNALARDALSGFLVFLIALPLCLGIAMASGYPPVAGVLTAVVGGLLGPFLGSARLTIKGPAAGLIVIVLGAVNELGEGNPALGYRRALAVGFVAAILQIVMALARVTKFGVAAPPSVVHGMLAAIGVIICAKQAHVLMGVTPHGREPLELLLEIPRSVMRSNVEVLAIGALGLAILFGWQLLGKRVAALAKVPAPLGVLATAVPLGVAFHMETPHDYTFLGSTYHLGPELLLSLPDNLAEAIVLPDFSAVLTGTSIKYVVMFALVGSLESTLSVLAVDALDPAKKASNLDRDLLTVGVANLVASAIGGLPMISEIVRSKANIDNGATSAWSNFFHGLCLLVFVAAAPGLLHLIPLAALAAMLVYTGTRLASLREVLHARDVGVDQLALFVTTALLTIAVDLLVGVAAGVALKIALHAIRSGTWTGLFRARVEATREGDELHVRVGGPATFLTLVPVLKACAPASSPGVTRVVVDVGAAPLVDHTFLERLYGAAQEWPTAKLSIRGLDELRPISEHPRAARRRLVGAWAR